MDRQEDTHNGVKPPAEKPAVTTTYSEDELYKLVPPDPGLAQAMPPLSPIIPEVVDEDGSVRDKYAPGVSSFGTFDRQYHFQFTLSDLFMLTTATAVLLGIISLLRWKWEYAAGLAGVGTFVCLLVITIVEPERRIAQTIWWTILVFYLLACLAAIITGG